MDTQMAPRVLMISEPLNSSVWTKMVLYTWTMLEQPYTLSCRWKPFLKILLAVCMEIPIAKVTPVQQLLTLKMKHASRYLTIAMHLQKTIGAYSHLGQRQH
uniref:Uncharacterized protein MANES_06G173000 n=1 Tax=Rhizophora mucronata TaxID=61149 RepID=A0A2P2KJB4_RHIMU